MTAWARLSDPKSGLIGTVTMALASATSSVSRPERSGPNRIADRAGDAAIWSAISCGPTTGMTRSRRRTVEAKTIEQSAIASSTRGEDLGLLENDVGAASGRTSVGVRPAVARCNQPHVGQPEVEHRSSRLADILAKLRADEDDDGLVLRRHSRRS